MSDHSDDGEARGYTDADRPITLRISDRLRTTVDQLGRTSILADSSARLDHVL